MFLAFSPFRASNAPRRPKRPPRPRQDRPRAPQDGPKTGQEGPRLPKRHPGQPQTAPEQAQDGPKSGSRRPREASEKPPGLPKGPPRGPREARDASRERLKRPKSLIFFSFFDVFGLLTIPCFQSSKTAEEPRAPQEAPGYPQDDTKNRREPSHQTARLFQGDFWLTAPAKQFEKKRISKNSLFFQSRPVSTLPRQSTNKAPVTTEERCHEAFDGHTSAEAKRKLMCFFVPLFPFVCDCDACAGLPSRSLHARNFNN